MHTLHIDVNAVVWQKFRRKTGPDKMAFFVLPLMWPESYAPY